MNAAKILVILVASIIAFALFGLSFSAVLGDGEGLLRATSVGLLVGLLSFLGTFWIARVLSDLGK